MTSAAVLRNPNYIMNGDLKSGRRLYRYELLRAVQHFTSLSAFQSPVLVNLTIAIILLVNFRPGFNSSSAVSPDLSMEIERIALKPDKSAVRPRFHHQPEDASGNFVRRSIQIAVARWQSNTRIC